MIIVDLRHKAYSRLLFKVYHFVRSEAGQLQEYEQEHAEFIYYTPRSADKEGQVWPVRGGRSAAKPHYRVGPKRIDCYSLHLLHEGELRFDWQGRRVRLTDGGLFCLFPGVTYDYANAAPDKPLRLSWLAFDGPRARALLALAGLTPEQPYREQGAMEAAGDAIGKLHALMRESGGWRPAAALELQSLLLGLFARLAAEAEPAQTLRPAGWLQDCIDFMELHASEGISVQQAADYAGVHRSYLAAAFIREFGISPRSYLQRVRMEKAKRLLRETDATVTEIALSLGYPNLFSFTRAFKAYCAVAPMMYRQRI